MVRTSEKSEQHLTEARERKKAAASNRRAPTATVLCGTLNQPGKEAKMALTSGS